ncbi:MAG: T9SS type A sorting domain-containing protein [Bacteroidota bacterium]
MYNATMLPARDTVINKCKIHVSPNPDTKTIFIAGDSNLVWLKNIRYNVSPCGKPVIDNAIIKYGLQKTSFSAPSWWNIHSVTYKKTNGNLNMYKLGLIFSAIPSSSGPNTTTIDGTDIEDSLNVNFTMLEYSYGWGDCWNGCMFRRYWQFKVFNDCSVEYIKSYGNAVPPNVAIKENEQLFSDVKVYPNPFNAKIRIDNLGSSSDRLSVFNTLGQTVFEVKGMVDKEIDLSYLSSGIFYLKLEKGFASRTFMIIKE